MRSGLALAVLVAGLVISPPAQAALPTPATSFWVSSRSSDLSDSLLNTDASGRVLADSAKFLAPGPTVNFWTTRESFFDVTVGCLNDEPHYTRFGLNGVKVAADGSFRADIVQGPGAQDPNPFRGRWHPARSEFHLRGRFLTPTTAKGTFWEIVYARRSATTPAFVGRTSAPSRLVRFCHTGGAKRGVRVTFTGVAKPLDWIVRNTDVFADLDAL